MGSYFSDKESNPCPMPWKHGPPGKSPMHLFFTLILNFFLLWSLDFGNVIIIKQLDWNPCKYLVNLIY